MTPLAHHPLYTPDIWQEVARFDCASAMHGVTLFHAKKEPERCREICKEVLRKASVDSIVESICSATREKKILTARVIFWSALANGQLPREWKQYSGLSDEAPRAEVLVKDILSAAEENNIPKARVIFWSARTNNQLSEGYLWTIWKSAIDNDYSFLIRDYSSDRPRNVHYLTLSLTMARTLAAKKAEMAEALRIHASQQEYLQTAEALMLLFYLPADHVEALQLLLSAIDSAHIPCVLNLATYRAVCVQCVWGLKYLLNLSHSKHPGVLQMEKLVQKTALRAYFPIAKMLFENPEVSRIEGKQLGKVLLTAMQTANQALVDRRPDRHEKALAIVRLILDSPLVQKIPATFFEKAENSMWKFHSEELFRAFRKHRIAQSSQPETLWLKLASCFSR